MSRGLLRISLLATLLMLPLVPQPASADASQLCRSISMITMAPTDILFAPYTTFQDIRMGYEDQDDHWVAKTIGTVPGYAMLNYLQAGGAILRVSAGVFEFIPGLFTLFRDEGPRPLFASQDEAEAVYSADFGPCPVRIGVHYNVIPWG
jgi:hypothetical protein